MRRWKDWLATLFLVVAVGLSLLPWMHKPKEVVADPPDYICWIDRYGDGICTSPPANCFCDIVIKPQQ